MSDGVDAVDLTIITVSWNVRDLLRDCLQSVEAARQSLDLEMIVVDSNSSDGSAQMVEHEFPWVRLIKSKENLGFARGNNLGIGASNGRNVLLLNPDTIVMSDALEIMSDYLDEHIDVGALGPQILNIDGSVQSSRRRFPSLLTGFFESTWLEGYAPERVMRRYYALDYPDNVENDVDWVTGACLMVPSRVIDHTGTLDEGYFMYSEELDWCKRIKEAGWRVVYLPTAQIVHYEGKSSEQAVTNRHINFQQSKLRYYRKHHGRIASGLLRIYLLTSYFWQLGLESMKGLLGLKRDMRRQRIQSYWQVIRSGLHPAGY